MNLKEQILAADDLEVEQVDVPEWGVTVWLRTLIGKDNEYWEELVGRSVHNGQMKLAGIKSTLVALCMVDHDGNRVFQNSEIGQLNGKGAAAINRLFDIAARLNRVTEKDVEELEKN